MNEAVQPPAPRSALQPFPAFPFAASTTSSSTTPQVPPCGTCRVTGTVSLGGISAWLLYQRSQVEVHARGHRITLAVMSAGFAVASAWRWNAD
jgi:hypothetical protein